MKSVPAHDLLKSFKKDFKSLLGVETLDFNKADFKLSEISYKLNLDENIIYDISKDAPFIESESDETLINLNILFSAIIGHTFKVNIDKLNDYIKKT